MSDSDFLTSLKHQGYAVVPLSLPQSLLDDVKQAILRFVDADEFDSHTWFRYASQNWSMVPIHHEQAVWNLRQHPALHHAFSQLFGTDALWVSMDRCGFKPPNPSAKAQPIHWDGDPRVSGHYQGLVCLTDTPQGMGGFRCMPTLFQNLSEWLGRRKEPQNPNESRSPIVDVPARAGDLILWDTRLPHAGGVNTSTKVRFAQYVTMYPIRTEAERLERVACVVSRSTPKQFNDFPPSLTKAAPPAPVTLSSLGKKLVGLEGWT
jgi:hypothetical protein